MPKKVMGRCLGERKPVGKPRAKPELDSVQNFKLNVTHSFKIGYSPKGRDLTSQEKKT